MLLCLRLLASLLIFLSMIKFFPQMDEPEPAAQAKAVAEAEAAGFGNSKKFYQFHCEYAVLLLAFCPVLFDSCIVFVSHKHSTSAQPLGWMCSAFTLVLVGYTIYAFVFQVLRDLMPLVIFRPTDKQFSPSFRELLFKKRNAIWHGLVARYLEGTDATATRREDDLYHIRLVQAGVADDKASEDALGESFGGPIGRRRWPTAFVAKPEAYTPGSAVELHQLDTLSLGLFSASLARALTVIADVGSKNSPITLGLLYGTAMKNNVRAPILWIRTADHAGTYAALCGSSGKPNSDTSEEAFTPKDGDAALELVGGHI